jgi:hypothetical protein
MSIFEEMPLALSAFKVIYCLLFSVQRSFFAESNRKTIFAIASSGKFNLPKVRLQ